jgi:hypothetical protein
MSPSGQPRQVGPKQWPAQFPSCPKTGQNFVDLVLTLWTITGLVHPQQTARVASLFDHIVGNGEHARRNGEAECFGGVEVDD